MDLAIFALRRVATMVISLLVLSVIIFALVRVLPGSPAQSMLGLQATPELVQQINHQLGLDRPVPVQYFSWLGGVVHGDFGTSLATSGTGGVSTEPVADIVASGLVITVWLSLLGIALASLLGVTLGLFGATRNHTSSDSLVSGISLLGISIPDFYMAFLLILLFTVHLRLLPSVGFVNPFDDLGGGIRSLILPVAAVGLINMSAVARITRNSVKEASHTDYVTLATLHGVPRRVIVGKHIFRNALVPILTVLGLQLGFLFGGVVVIETVFSLPGMGRYLVLAVNQRDYPTIEALIMSFAALFMTVNLLVDIAYAVIDPRIRVRS